MNKDQILQLAEKAGLLNHHELTTPTDYFVSGNADTEEVLKFAELLIAEFKPDLDRLNAYDEELSKEMPLDYKDWWESSKSEWPEVARMTLEGRRERLEWCYNVIGVQQERIKELEEETKDLNDHKSQ
jgi:hypothetical protein